MEILGNVRCFSRKIVRRKATIEPCWNNILRSSATQAEKD